MIVLNANDKRFIVNNERNKRFNKDEHGNVTEGSSFHSCPMGLPFLTQDTEDVEKDRMAIRLLLYILSQETHFSCSCISAFVTSATRK